MIKEDKEHSRIFHRWTIPASWMWVSLAETGQVVTGNTPSTKDRYNYGADIPFVKPPELIDKGIRSASDGLTQKGMASARILPPGAVLVSCIGNLGKTGIARIPVAFNQQINAVIFNEKVIPEYGFYYLQTLKNWLYGVASATTLPIVNKGKFQQAPFPLAPISEQEQIVEEIEKQFSRLDEAIASLKRVKANLKRYKAAVLKAAVEGKLTEQWRKEHPDIEPASELLKRILVERRKKWEEAELARMKAKGIKLKDDSWKKKYKEPDASLKGETFDIPDTWVWSNLGQLAWAIKDGPHYSPEYSEAGIPFISGGNVRPEGIDFSTAKYISPELHAELSKRCKPEYGDLLYTKGGTTGIARINTETHEFNVWVHVAVLKLVNSLHRFYLQYALNSPHCYKQSQRYTHGVGNQDLGLTRMIWITVPLPPLKEQKVIIREIERKLSIVDEIENEIETNLKRAERLRQSILKEAFSGKLARNIFA